MFRSAPLLVLLLCACGPQDARLSTGGEGSLGRRLGDNHLRLMAGNLSSGNRQAYGEEGVRLFRAAQPDVAMLQEFNVGASSAAELRAFVDQAFGPEFQFARGAPAQIPNGVVSRFPILASGDWTDALVGNRAFTWARLDVPGPTDLWVVSVHLLTRSPDTRLAEAQALVGVLSQQVPPGDFVVIAGDFNTATRDEPALGALASTVVTAGPWPVDALGDGDTNSPRSKPYDWVLASPGLQAHAVATDLGGFSSASGVVLDTRVAAIAPALPTDSAAVGMQHMGVIRDFDLSPLPPPPPPAVLHLDSPNGGERLTAGASVEVQWTASGVGAVNVELATDGVTFSPVASAVDPRAGAIAWTVPSLASDSAVLRLVSAEATDSSDAPFHILMPAPVPPAKVIIDEVLANEPGTATSKEFVELMNVGGAPADLSGWALSDAQAVRHRFPAGVVLAPGARLVIFGGAAGVDASLPQAAAASTGTLSLNNASDTVSLLDAAGAVQDVVTYSGALAATDGVSMTRQETGVSGSPFVLHTTVSGVACSPGAPPR